MNGRQETKQQLPSTLHERLVCCLCNWRRQAVAVWRATRECLSGVPSRGQMEAYGNLLQPMSVPLHNMLCVRYKRSTTQKEWLRLATRYCPRQQHTWYIQPGPPVGDLNREWHMPKLLYNMLWHLAGAPAAIWQITCRQCACHCCPMLLRY
jgi:hypothetical protein